MTPAQTLALRASDIRSRLAELGGTPDLSDEQNAEISELRNEYQDVEKRSAALIVAGDKPIEPVVKEQRSEDRELDGLIAGASIGQIFNAAIEKRATEGQTAELQTELKLAGNQIPLALLLETRAAGVTNAPANVGQNQAEIIPAVFPQSCAAFLRHGHADCPGRRSDLSGSHDRRGCWLACRACCTSRRPKASLLPRC